MALVIFILSYLLHPFCLPIIIFQICIFMTGLAAVVMVGAYLGKNIKTLTNTHTHTHCERCYNNVFDH